MTIGNFSPVGNNGQRRGKRILEEEAPLLPSKQEETGEFDEFNGASFAGPVFNLFSRAGKIVSCGGVMGDAFGRTGKVLIQLCIIMNNVGVLIVYMIIIGDVLSGTSSSGNHHFGVLEGWFGQHWWTRWFFILLVSMLAVFAPLACFKRVDSLRFTSALSVALAIVFVVITAGIAIVKLLAGSIAMPKLFPDIPDLTSVWNFFTVVPVIVTAYICHYNVHPIENELEDPSQIKPVALRLNVDGLLFPSARPLSSDNWRFAIITAVLLSAVFLAANFIPSIWDAFQFTGATAAVCIGFIFPAAITLRHVAPDIKLMWILNTACMHEWDKIVAVFMIGLAVLSNVIAIYSDAYALFNESRASPES
ncbi:hypothetical protein OPV22_012958 [Ensete ventricosum]|uniref:Amino acid transporter transmembrane domain-containing protein n=1 Tax=Ensete ventricosum TaxID=4639 RepID=A0AAV8R4A1_ENSVE|nr:hypothetical protein OPV22_012958 [Ensete ventricosum]